MKFKWMLHSDQYTKFCTYIKLFCLGLYTQKNLKSSILATQNVLEGIVDSVVLHSLSYATCHNQKQLQLVILITFYSPSCLGHKIAKGPFGLQAATCLSKVKIWKTFSQSHTRSPSWLWWILEQTMISRHMETTMVMQHIFTICNSISFWGFDELQLLLTCLMQIKVFADWHCLLWLKYVSMGFNNNKLQYEKA